VDTFLQYQGEISRINTGGIYGLNKARSYSDNDDNAALKKACMDFETIFIETIIKAMRETVPKDGLFSGGFGEEIFEELFDQKIALKMTSRGGLGIADTLYNRLNVQRAYSKD
jgi:flagellar protein FlgJ